VLFRDQLLFLMAMLSVYKSQRGFAASLEHWQELTASYKAVVVINKREK
jgi:hypothetical protein